MRVRSEHVTGTALAEAFAKIEGRDRRATKIVGPRHLLAEVRTWGSTIYVPRDDTLWGAKLTDDDSLDALHVTDD